MPIANPHNTADQAVAKAKLVSRWTVGMCDQFVAQMYGYGSSGYATAIDNWTATPANLKHPGDMNAPAGSLMYWSGGMGHVALSTGNGSIVSTDIGGPGTVTTVPASQITQKWGKSYLGWSYPYFQGKQATNSLGAFTGSTPVANAVPAGNVLGIDPSAITKGFLKAFLGPFMGLMNMFVWGVETLVGMLLIGLGIYVIVRHQ